MTATLRIGTWNIREAVPLSGDRDGALPKLVDTLARAELDVVALQEVTFARDGSSRQLDAISSSTGLTHPVTYRLSPSAFHPGLCSGLALLSRTPLGPVSRAALPNPNLRHQGPAGLLTSWSKGLVAACIGRDRMAVWVACVHGYPFHRFGRCSAEPEFAPIWQALGIAIDGLPAGPLVVSGDFNCRDRSLVIRHLGRPVRSAADGALAHDRALRRGDDVLYGTGLTLEHVTVTKTFSDHPLLSTEFALESEEL